MWEAGTWSVVCGWRQQVPHLGVFESLHPLDVQGSQQRAAGRAESRDGHPGAAGEQQHPQTCSRRRSSKNLY